MTIAPSAVAHVVGVTTQFEDLRGGNVLYLPQRIAIFAQGQTGVTFPSTKWEVTGAGAGGAKFGFKSAIYLMLRELLPANGDGVGIIPVTVYPLPADGGGGAAAAAGDITPSGTATEAAEYRVSYGGVLSDPFVIPAGALATAVNLTLACKRMREAMDAVEHMPCTTTYDYGTVTASALTGTGNGTIGTFTTSGGPKPGVWRLTVNTVAAHGGVWTLTDPDGIEVADDLTMTGGTGATTALSAGGLGFSLTDGATDFGLGAYFDITVPATSVNTTHAWKGPTGNYANGCEIEIIDALGDLTFAITQPTGGLINPSITTALAQMGGKWETLVLNGATIEDTTLLDEFQTFGEGRWGDTVKKPLMVFTGNTKADLDDATAQVEDRQTDKINCQLVAPGSSDLPLVVAARELAKIAVVANEDPPRNYTGQKVTGISPGTDGEQWDGLQREIAVNRGSSTVEVVDGVIQLGDVMTCYRPSGEVPPAYRYVCDVIKVMNILFNLRLIFEAPEWAGATLVPDEQPVKKATVKKPKMAKAEISSLMDNLGFEAIIIQPDIVTPALPGGARGTIFAGIDSQNPKRLNVGGVFPITGNAQIIDVQLRWGFFFGATALAA
jgi:phage tail sheath gpL-like